MRRTVALLHFEAQARVIHTPTVALRKLRVDSVATCMSFVRVVTSDAERDPREARAEAGRSERRAAFTVEKQ
ncbi:hypothetical protein E2542_SST14575 [Spatholobus suberectus]|nr:hypothetical protein E2542_SST14575 [Spatholobus suberectus]